MAQKSQSQLVKYQTKKHKFEILTKPGMVLKYRDGKIGWPKVMMVDQVFTNSTRGDVASSSDLIDVFNTDDINECLQKIVIEGELQLTATERKQFLEQKTNEIVYFINKNYVDPKTKKPHPSNRIANCLKEIKFRVDPNGDARKQGEEAVQKMRGKLLFTKAVCMTAKLTINHQHVGQCTNLIHKIANVIHEEWIAEGCVFTVEVSNSDLSQLQLALQKPTNGNYNFKFLDDSMLNDTANDSNQKNKKKNKKKDKKKKAKQDSNNNNNNNNNNKNDNNDTKNNNNNNNAMKEDKKKKKKDKKKKQKYDGSNQ